LAGQGIPKLVIFNGHGANDFRQMIRELQPQVSPFLCVVNWYKVLDLNGFFSDQGDHAGEMETSVMQHIAPELVLPLSEAGPGASCTPISRVGGSPSRGARGRAGIRGRRVHRGRSRSRGATSRRAARKPTALLV